jgi:hypothetical protein
MRKTFLTLLAGLTAISAHAIEITATPDATVVWKASPDQSNPILTLASNPGGLFSTTSSMMWFVASTIDHPFAFIMPSDRAFTASDKFYRYGEMLDLSSISTSGWYDVTFVLESVLSGNAVSGSDNYMAINWEDGNGDNHFGWLQFDVNPINIGSPAITFLKGDLNAAPGGFATAGVASVPEPSAALLLLPAAAMLPFYRRFRKAA